MGSTHHFIVDTGSSFNILPIQMKQKLELNGVDMKTANDVKLRGVTGETESSRESNATSSCEWLSRKH